MLKKAMKSVLFAWLCLLLLAGCGMVAISPETQAEDYTTFESVAKHLMEHQKLPDNFITKAEARKLGWNPQKGNLDEVAPGKSIGGDVFHNRERKLPDKKGRTWYEADIHYKGGPRGKYRILYSNDGFIYKTEDHYKTFEQIT